MRNVGLERTLHLVLRLLDGVLGWKILIVSEKTRSWEGREGKVLMGSLKGAEFKIA
jgi:hypothetical protein